MKIKIKVTTPAGQAAGTMKKIKWFFRLTKGKLNTYINDADDTMFIEFEGDIKRCLEIQKKIVMFNQLPQLILENKILKKAANKFGATPEQYEELKSMFRDGTKIEILKEATAQEIVEANQTFWDKVKQTFKRKTETL